MINYACMILICTKLSIEGLNYMRLTSAFTFAATSAIASVDRTEMGKKSHNGAVLPLSLLKTETGTHTSYLQSNHVGYNQSTACKFTTSTNNISKSRDMSFVRPVQSAGRPAGHSGSHQWSSAPVAIRRRKVEKKCSRDGWVCCFLLHDFGPEKTA